MGDMARRLHWMAGELPARVVAASLRLSYAHSRNPHDALALPIVAGPGARIIRQPGSQVSLGGTLFLGYGPPEGPWRTPGRRGARGPVPETGPALVRVGRDATFVTGGWTVLREGVEVRIARGATLELGDGVYVNERARIEAHESVTIGGGSAISWDVLILDTDYHHLAVGGEERPARAPVRLGERVWVGTRCIVTKGVTIGDGAVVAAGSVVTRDIPARCLAAGAPARVVREDVDWWP